MATGEILKNARRAARVSQLDLALSLGVSQRHVSFVESGRSGPSRDLIIAWMTEVRALDSVRNAALLSAGFSLFTERDSRRPAEIEEVSPVHRCVLDHHDPMPGMIFNADWRMLRLNAGAQWLLGLIMGGFLDTLGEEAGGWDMIAGIGHPGGLLSQMPEPWVIGRRHLTQLRIEELNRPVLKPRTDALEEALRAGYGDRLETAGTAPEPGLSLRFDTVHGRLNFFTVQTVFKLPQDVAPTTVRTGLWYPSDHATRDVLRRHVRTDPDMRIGDDAA